MRLDQLVDRLRAIGISESPIGVERPMQGAIGHVTVAVLRDGMRIVVKTHTDRQRAQIEHDALVALREIGLTVPAILANGG